MKESILCSVMAVIVCDHLSSSYLLRSGSGSTVYASRDGAIDDLSMITSLYTQTHIHLMTYHRRTSANTCTWFSEEDWAQLEGAARFAQVVNVMVNVEHRARASRSLAAGFSRNPILTEVGLWAGTGGAIWSEQE